MRQLPQKELGFVFVCPRILGFSHPPSAIWTQNLSRKQDDELRTNRDNSTKWWRPDVSLDTAVKGAYASDWHSPSHSPSHRYTTRQLSRLEAWPCPKESRVTTVTPTAAMNSSSRKPHRKSRSGCGRCKKRKIKVSEGSLLAPFAGFLFQLKCGVAREQSPTRDLGLTLPPSSITFEVFLRGQMLARLTYGP